jgi:hypothetical protein
MPKKVRQQGEGRRHFTLSKGLFCRREVYLADKVGSKTQGSGLVLRYQAGALHRKKRVEPPANYILFLDRLTVVGI